MRNSSSASLLAFGFVILSMDSHALAIASSTASTWPLTSSINGYGPGFAAADLEVEAVKSIHRTLVTSGNDFSMTEAGDTRVETGKAPAFSIGGFLFAEVSAFGGSTALVSTIHSTRVTVTNPSDFDVTAQVMLEWFNTPAFASHEYEGEFGRTRSRTLITEFEIKDFPFSPSFTCDSTVLQFPGGPANVCSRGTEASGSASLSKLLSPGGSFDFWFTMAVSAEAVSVPAPGMAFTLVPIALWANRQRRAPAGRGNPERG